MNGLTENELRAMPETDFEARLIAEVRRLRQGLFDCFKLAGGDTDGDDGPEAWMSDIVEATKRVVANLRESYEQDADAPRIRIGPVALLQMPGLDGKPVTYARGKDGQMHRVQSHFPSAAAT